MKKNKFFAILLAGALCVLSLTSCFDNEDSKTGENGTENAYPGISTYNWKYADDEVMFELDGTPFTFDMYRYYAMNYKSDYDIGDASYWNEITEEQFEEDMIYELKKLEAISALCKERGISLDETDYEAIDSQDEMFKTVYGEEFYNEQLDVAYLTENLHKEMNAYSVLLQKLYEDYAPAEEIMTYANDNYCLVTHILVSTKDENDNDITGDALAEKTALADELYKRAISGEDFASLIETYGEDPGMKTSPDGYFFTYGNMVKEFETASFELEVGEISEPVKSSFGYHIIKKFPLEESFILDKNGEAYWPIVAAIAEMPAQKAVQEYAETIGVVKTDAFNALTMDNIAENK